MDRDKIGVLLKAAKEVTNHSEFVIIGSLSVLGKSADAPDEMVHSIDVDMFPRADPNRVDEINREIGQGTDFEAKHGYYADAVSPYVASLPDGWESRLIPVQYPDNIVGYYLDPNDAAVAKLARHEPRDVRWFRAGLVAGVIDPDAVERRIGTAHFANDDEIERARATLKRERKRVA